MALVATVPAAGPAGAIAHGEPVPEGRYRFSARLMMTGIPLPGGGRTAAVCSGALIAPSWVITAGHCFVDAQGDPVSGPVPYPTSVIVGTSDLLMPSRRRRTGTVTQVRQAPGTDIALARLAQPVTDVMPILLSTTAPAVGTTLRFTGWGATSSLIPVPTTHLQTGEVTITGVTGTTVGVTGQSPAPDTSACAYDSGAPYFVEPAGRPRLVAIESDGPPCPHALEETTARVDTVAPWIVETIHAAR